MSLSFKFESVKLLQCTFEFRNHFSVNYYMSIGYKIFKKAIRREYVLNTIFRKQICLDKLSKS